MDGVGQGEEGESRLVPGEQVSGAAVSRAVGAGGPAGLGTGTGLVEVEGGAGAPPLVEGGGGGKDGGARAGVIVWVRYKQEREEKSAG